jgi:hypothetical protein
MATALQRRCDRTGQFRGVWGTFASKSAWNLQGADTFVLYHEQGITFQDSNS